MLIDINKVVVKDRIRKDFGDIEELAQDIKENGLINPPVVTPDHVLIAGERRIRALRALGKTDIEVRIMTVDSAEQALNLEISENEVRKDFSKSERIDYARRLERIEAAKAESRLKSGKRGSEGKTRDIVADKMGIGSGKQYEKEKTIVENKELLSPDDFAEWDEGKLSTNKAFKKVKAELEELKAKEKLFERQTEDVAYMAECLSKANKKIKEYEKGGVKEDQIKIIDDANVFILECRSFLSDHKDNNRLVNNVDRIPTKERKALIESLEMVKEWSVSLLGDIEKEGKEV